MNRTQIAVAKALAAIAAYLMVTAVVSLFLGLPGLTLVLLFMSNGLALGAIGASLGVLANTNLSPAPEVE